MYYVLAMSQLVMITVLADCLLKVKLTKPFYSKVKLTLNFFLFQINKK